MGHRYERCAKCGQKHYVRPLYERTYKEDDKSGRFRRAFWLCGPCFEALAGLQVPATKAS